MKASRIVSTAALIALIGRRSRNCILQGCRSSRSTARTGGRSPSFVFGAESLEASRGTFVPALMLERQRSGLL